MADPAPADGAEVQKRYGRFLQLSDVCEILDISASQTYALVRSGELPAIKIGGRGQWRVELAQLEQFIERMYTETRNFVSTHPFGSGEEWSTESVVHSVGEEPESDESDDSLSDSA